MKSLLRILRKQGLVRMPHQEHIDSRWDTPQFFEPCSQSTFQHRSGQQRFGQRITISPWGGASKAPLNISELEALRRCLIYVVSLAPGAAIHMSSQHVGTILRLKLKFCVNVKQLS